MRREVVHTTRLTQVLDAPPALVWALCADSNRWDRCLGLNPSTYAPRTEGAGPAGPRIGTSTLGGLRLAWTETGEWIEGRSMWGERRFSAPLRTRAGYRFSLAPAGEGTRVDIEAYSAGQSPLGHAVSRFWRRRFRSRLVRFLASIAEALRGVSLGGDDAPASARAARALLDRPAPAAVAGPRSPTDERALAARGVLLSRLPVAETLRRRLVDLLRGQPDDVVRELRPFDVADAWGADRREVLAAFLQATRAGLVDLSWRLICPVCRLGAGVADSLETLERRVHCDECCIDFDVDFGENVEAVFSISQALRRTAPVLHCGGSPWFRPHVVARQVLAPGETRALLAPLPGGPLLVRALGHRRRQVVGAETREGVIEIEADGAHLRPAAGVLLLANRTPREVTILVERAGWSSAVVRGSLLATLPDYLGLFGTQAPAAGRQIQIGRLALCFVDIVASTELYEREGDARGYALVQAHQREAIAAVGRHQGAVVKTLGDGVMASFARAHQALEAGLELVAAAEALAWREGVPGFAVRVGVHEGPCFLVRANDRLDLFGTTVNLAARLETEAAPGQIVMLAELLADPDLRAVLDARRPQLRKVQSRLRGLRGHYSLAVLSPPDAGARAGRGGDPRTGSAV